MREKTVEWALKEKIIAIVRGMEAKDCLRVAQALYDGGIRLMEITYDQRDPAQWAKTADAIGKIAEAFEGRMLVGAGTVTTPELVTRTRDAGGQFIISPDTNPAVIARTRELELVSMPGAMTPSEFLRRTPRARTLSSSSPPQRLARHISRPCAAPSAMCASWPWAASMRKTPLSS